MPLLDYICKDCGYIFEKRIIDFKSKPDVFCPACFSRNVKRKYYPASNLYLHDDEDEQPKYKDEK